MRFVGITGTKGKTTTSYLLKAIMEEAGYKTGLIGTTGNMIGSEYLKSEFTTPEPIDFFRTLRQMRDAGVTAVSMEVSAHAIAMANGSVTLDAALRALDLQPGDEVIVSPRSFVVSASCVLLAGGRPVFFFFYPDSGNLTPDSIAPLISARTRGIIPVHLGGWPCDMAGIMALAAEHGLGRRGRGCGACRGGGR